MAWDGIERRKAQRVAIAAQVDIDGRESFCYTRDLSSRGMSFECAQPPAVGSMLEVKVALPGVRQILPIRGKIVRHISHQGFTGAAVEFCDTPDEFIMLIEETLIRLTNTAAKSTSKSFQESSKKL